MLVKHIGFSIIDRPSNRHAVSRAAVKIAAWFINSGCNGRLCGPVSITQTHAVSDLFLPNREFFSRHLLAPNDDQPDFGRNPNLFQLRNPLMPIRRGQVQNCNFLLFDEVKEALQRRDPNRLTPWNDGGAAQPSWKNF